jgi:hypothetical protein
VNYTEQINKAKAELGDALRDAGNKEDSLHKLYGEILQAEGHDPADLIVPGVWKCEKSPVETCVYNFFEDPCHDSCIFCGDPRERK